ncbi:hypothetical protein PSHT_00362 [Puccinia striiformis]|uniref:Uncharacterized protein n=2 Tax=Puccinia striiformis TaxID=27350 RepID=A0A0L0VVY1_9BASI|nr:hypothetical protein PSTG_03737 [Puccinia striiformis f. sp. tritici PST-78]POW23234.1 hypothetical protein PSHT_00362 [Puccinia striiformis]
MHVSSRSLGQCLKATLTIISDLKKRDNVQVSMTTSRPFLSCLADDQASRKERIEKTYLSRMEKFSPKALQRPHTSIEEELSVILSYINKWLQSQLLWDLKADHLYGKLG